MVCEGSILDLALHWGPGDRVVVVDAMPAGSRPGRIVSIDVDRPTTLSTPAAVSTHEIDVSVAIELARAIGRMPARLVVVGIEAAQTKWCAALSPAVAAAAETAVDQLVDRMTRSS